MSQYIVAAILILEKLRLTHMQNSVLLRAPLNKLPIFLRSTTDFRFSEFHDAATALEKEDRKIAQLVRRHYLETGFFFPRDMFDYIHAAEIDTENSFVGVENGVTVILSEAPIFRIVNALRRQHIGYQIDFQFEQQNKLPQTESVDKI